MRNTLFCSFVLTTLLILLSSCDISAYRNVSPYITPEEHDSIQSLAARLRNEGRKMRENSEFTQALQLQQLALEASIKIDDTISIVHDYNQLGTTFRRLGRIEHAMNNHYLALNIAEEYHEDTSKVALKNIVVSCNGLGNVYLSMDNDELAEPYFRRALEGEKKLNSLLGMAINYANLGSILERREMLDSARWYYDQSMQMNVKLGSEMGISLCHVHFGRIYERQDSLLLAEAEFRKAAEAMADNPDRYHAFEPLISLGRNLMKQQRLDEAETFVDQAFEVAKDIHSYESLMTVCHLKADLLEQKHDIANALSYYRQSMAWHDSISSPETENKLRQVCIDYELQTSRHRLDVLQDAYDDNERMHTTVIIVVIALLFISLVAICLLMYASSSRKARIEALNRLDSMRTTFFRNLTHEFRTPLTVIMGLAEELKNNDVLPDQRQHLLNSIRNQGNTLLTLVNELLGISKMMSGSETCEWRHGDIVPFLRMTLTGYTDFARMRNIQLVFVSEQEKIEMDFVPDYYQKIMSNLLGNSFKHTPSGGSITVSVKSRSGHMMLDVADTGEGVSEIDLPHIFELFYQGHNSSKQGSTGIGLPYVHQMVRQMGGIISAENTMPRGVTMHIIIATQCSDPQLPIRPWTMDESLHSLSHHKPLFSSQVELPDDSQLPIVLVVEDNPDISDYIALLLHSRYHVLKATDGYEALRIVGNQLPDIILTDLMMPGIDGYELCHSIRQSAVLSDVPIVIISARSEDKDRVRGYEDGADGYLLKPFNPSELHALISRLLDQRRQQRLHMQQLISHQQQPVAEVSDVAASHSGGRPAMQLTDVEAQEFIANLCRVVNEQMMQGNLQVDAIANILCLSRSTLARRIKEITGSSPSAFILQLRLDHACHLLLETNLSISEIALSCGFDDTSYFSRVFRQNFEVTPSQYRQSQPTLS